MGLEQTWKNLSSVQKIGVVAAGGIGGLYLMSKMGGASASVGSSDPNLNILDVRRPTDDINAPGSRDPMAFLIRDIFRDLNKDKGVPVVNPPAPPPGPGNKDRLRELGQNKRLNRGLMTDLRMGGVDAAERERITKLQGRNRTITQRMIDLGFIRQPPPNNGQPPPRTRGGTRGTGIS